MPKVIPGASLNIHTRDPQLETSRLGFAGQQRTRLQFIQKAKAEPKVKFRGAGLQRKKR